MTLILTQLLPDLRSHKTEVIELSHLPSSLFVYRDNYVSLQEYMAFMISRETENVQSSSDVEAAFRALTSAEKPYITAQELYAVCQLLSLFHNHQRKSHVG